MSVLDTDARSKDERERNLSNFAAHTFTFDGVECASIEGVLQAHKTSATVVQERVCQMKAERIHFLYKRAFDQDWQPSQRLHWQNKRFLRDSNEYHEQITRLYDCVFEQSDSFRDAVQASVGYELRHSNGKHATAQTVLTVSEFLAQLYRLRTHL